MCLAGPPSLLTTPPLHRSGEWGSETTRRDPTSQDGAASPQATDPGCPLTSLQGDRPRTLTLRHNHSPSREGAQRTGLSLIASNCPLPAQNSAQQWPQPQPHTGECPGMLMGSSSRPGPQLASPKDLGPGGEVAAFCYLWNTQGMCLIPPTHTPPHQAPGPAGYGHGHWTRPLDTEVPVGLALAPGYWGTQGLLCQEGGFC